MGFEEIELLVHHTPPDGDPTELQLIGYAYDDGTISWELEAPMRQLSEQSVGWKLKDAMKSERTAYEVRGCFGFCFGPPPTPLQASLSISGHLLFGVLLAQPLVHRARDRYLQKGQLPEAGVQISISTTTESIVRSRY